ncbi:ankyrin repeat-containing domain protein [Trichophaea hybrida]|nr:ankyrin repeat-containing domain protein [Trichophaea hybrida]
MVAVDAQDLSMVRFLLQKGANVNERGEDGRSALHDAVLGSPEIVRLLLEHGADIDARDYSTELPLYTAVLNNRAHSVQLLLESGASSEVGDMPTLHLAVEISGWNSPKDTCDTVGILLEYREDPTIIFGGRAALQVFFIRNPNPEDDEWMVEEYDEIG